MICSDQQAWRNDAYRILKDFLYYKILYFCVYYFEECSNKRKARITIKSRENAFLEKGRLDGGEDGHDNGMFCSFTLAVRQTPEIIFYDLF